MSNKKCKITSVSELIKSKKTETSVSELIKSNKKCKVETPKTSMAELMKPKKIIHMFAIVFVAKVRKLIITLRKNIHIMKIYGNRDQKILEKIRKMPS
jgi:hypothetical protein